MRVDNETRAGRVDSESVVELPQADVGTLLLGGPDALANAAVAKGPVHDFGAMDFAPVIPRPGKLICVGLNYRSHIAEMGRQPDDYPTLFATFAEALIGARDPIILPSASSQVDWEAELAVIIGRPVRKADMKAAEAAIAGFSVYNDVSARDWQWRTSQWLSGKTFEGTSPLGPSLVTVDEVGPEPQLDLTCHIDDELVQNANTSDLVFGPTYLVSYLSQILTLMPGDIISTGTPGGTGAGFDPPRFLRPGQNVRTYVEGLGEQTNRCISEGLLAAD